MGKRVLFLTPQPPYPPHQGTAIRNYNLIAQVASRHEVSLLSFADPGQEPAALEPLRKLCVHVDTVPAPTRSRWHRLTTVLTSPLPDLVHRLQSPEFQVRLQERLGAGIVDIVHVEGLEMAHPAFQVRSQAADPKLRWIYDAHNAEYVLQQRIFATDRQYPARWVGALYSWIQWLKLRGYEASICRQADHVLACSPADAIALSRLAPAVQPIVVANGVDIEYYQPDAVMPIALSSPTLVFTGKMDFRPNVDAVLWFCDQVLPLIRAEAPQIHLYIVGKDPHPRLATLASTPGVTLTGFVEDVRPYIAAASVYIVPLLTGGGTRLKVLEAMAMGKAIVATSLGCEGIPAKHGCHLLLADSAEAFAHSVLTLVHESAARSALGTAAREFAVNQFDWQRVTAPLEKLYAQ